MTIFKPGNITECVSVRVWEWRGTRAKLVMILWQCYLHYQDANLHRISLSDVMSSVDIHACK